MVERLPSAVVCEINKERRAVCRITEETEGLEFFDVERV